MNSGATAIKTVRDQGKNFATDLSHYLGQSEGWLKLGSSAIPASMVR
jgi:hypothetical protein